MTSPTDTEGAIQFRSVFRTAHGAADLGRHGLWFSCANCVLVADTALLIAMGVGGLIFGALFIWFAFDRFGSALVIAIIVACAIALLVFALVVVALINCHGANCL